MKLGTQLFLCIVAVIGLAMYEMCDFTLSELKPRYREAIEETLVDAAHIVAFELGAHWEEHHGDPAWFARSFPTGTSDPIRAQIYGYLKTSLDLRVTITNKEGIILFDSLDPAKVGSDASQWRDVFLTLRGEYGARTTRDDPENPLSTVLYVAAPIRSAGIVTGVVALGKPTKSSNFFINELRSRLLRVTGLTAFSLVVIASVLARFVTRPIRLLTEYARDVAAGNERPPPRFGKGEIGELGHAFFAMRHALEGHKYVEEYVQHLTHELKSPVAAIRGAAELLEDSSMDVEQRQRFVANIASESGRLQRILERLLELSSLEHQNTELRTERFSLREIVEEVFEALSAKSAVRGVHLTVDAAKPVMIEAERFLVWQLCANVVDNALDFSPPGGTVSASLVPDSVRGTVMLTVRDEGPGFPDYALDRLGEKFYSLPRPDTGKKSSGLGLSFVKAVVRRHAGSVQFSNVSEDVSLRRNDGAAPGKEAQLDAAHGAVVRIELPMSQSQVSRSQVSRGQGSRL